MFGPIFYVVFGVISNVCKFVLTGLAVRVFSDTVVRKDVLNSPKRKSKVYYFDDC